MVRQRPVLCDMAPMARLKTRLTSGAEAARVTRYTGPLSVSVKSVEESFWEIWASSQDFDSWAKQTEGRLVTAARHPELRYLALISVTVW